MSYRKDNFSFVFPWNRRDYIDKLAFWLIFLLIIFIIYLFVRNYSDSLLLYKGLQSTKGGNILIICSKILIIVNIITIIWRIYLWKRYNTKNTFLSEPSFSISIVVPAYNEEAGIYNTIMSIVNSDYPKDKIQLVVVDDGSTDSTYQQILLALEKCEYSGVVIEIIRFGKNMGKRVALFEGFNICKNEIIVTIDSDSIILPQTLKKLVYPFINNKDIGAVAGNVKILNHSQGIIPRMLDVSFNFCFNFIRAGQSHLDAVLVTPGALSAYRAGLVNKVKENWLNQTFLGVKARIGEDRAMNNYIVKLGYRSVYQKEAMVFTKVPTSYFKLGKMYLRWARSNIRETILMLSFIFKPFRNSSKTGLRIIYILHVLALFLPVLLKIQIVLALFINPSLLLLLLFAGAVLVSIVPFTIYALNHKSRNGIWAYFYSIFFAFALWWIIPFAFLTLRNNKWLTKNK
jgi:hyaluronan synthase